jgi:hypothetical protein
VGHDIIGFSGGHALFSDFSLWLLRHFFVLEARAVADEEKSSDAIAAVQFFERWDWQGPGVHVGMDFDAFVSSAPGRIERLLRILERARRKVSGFGAFIPLEYLQEHLNSETAYFVVSQPVEGVCRDIDRLIALLKNPEPNQALQPTAPSGRG